MTQLQRALEILARGRLHHLDLTDLDDILSAAQNSPPQGDSDGSIKAIEWYVLRDIVWHTRAAHDATRRFKASPDHGRTVCVHGDVEPLLCPLCRAEADASA